MQGDDYEPVHRLDSSIKYRLALKYRQPKVDPSKALVVSHADMEFKASPQLMAKLKSNLG